MESRFHLHFVLHHSAKLLSKRRRVNIPIPNHWNWLPLSCALSSNNCFVACLVLANTKLFSPAQCWTVLKPHQKPQILLCERLTAHSCHTNFEKGKSSHPCRCCCGRYGEGLREGNVEKTKRKIWN